MPSPDESETVVQVYSTDNAIDKYTEMNEFGLYEAEAKLVDRYFQPRTARVLDVACGAGRTTKPLAVTGYDVVGIDISNEMASKAKSVIPGTEVCVSDASSLPFRDESFDFVLFSYVNIDLLYPRAQRLRALREMNRVLKRGGLLLFGTSNSLHVVPALFQNRDHLRRFYVRNDNYRRLFRAYKKDPDEWGLNSYFGTQPRTLWDLRRCGFRTEHVGGARDSLLRFLEKVQYYVARKSQDV